MLSVSVSFCLTVLSIGITIDLPTILLALPEGASLPFPLDYAHASRIVCWGRMHAARVGRRRARLQGEYCARGSGMRT